MPHIDGLRSLGFTTSGVLFGCLAFGGRLLAALLVVFAHVVRLAEMETAD